MQPVRKTVIFLLDASESMLVKEQTKLAKGAVLGLLTQAYQKRYRAGVVVFRDNHAKEILPPTTSIARARAALQAVATGGGTPLAEGLETVLKVIRSENIRHPNDQCQMVLVTDGRPSVAINKNADLKEEVLSIAAKFSEKKIPSIVLASSESSGIIKEIADCLKAPLRKISSQEKSLFK